MADTLRALHEKATPGPWEKTAAWMLGQPMTEADARLLVALRNAAPDILAVLDAAHGLLDASALTGHPGDEFTEPESRVANALDRLREAGLL